MNGVRRSGSTGAIAPPSVKTDPTAPPKPALLREPNAPATGLVPVSLVSSVGDQPRRATVEAQLIGALNLSTFERLTSIAAGKRTHSTMLSAPAALGLVAPLFHGATHAHLLQIGKELGLTGATPDEIKGAAQSVLARAQVKTAIWLRPDFVVDHDFVQRVQQTLGTEVLTVAPEVLEGRVDNWSFGATHGRVTGLAKGDIFGKTDLLVTSAVSFDPLWQTFFKPSDTIAEYTFIRADGETIAVPMMTGVVQCNATATEDYRAVQLPLEGGRSFIAIVPGEEVPIEPIIREIATPDGLQRFVASLEAKTGMVYIPKIRIEAARDGGALLKDATRGPYEVVGSRPVHVLGALEISTMRFSEPGVTIGGGAAGSFWSGKAPKRTDANAPEELIEAARPFLYLVRDDASGLIIGAGVYEGPEEKPHS